METASKILYEGGQGEIIEKKSRFIANIFPVTTEEEALEKITAMRKKYYDARHNCFAYILGENKDTVRCSDDGEPSGTAGGKLDSLKDLTGIHLEALRGKSPEQLAEMLKERESRLSALLKERRPFRKDRIRSNPTAVSPKYAREFEELKKHFEDEGRNANPQ